MNIFRKDKKEAIATWCNLLGSGGVAHDEKTLSSYSSATFSTSQPVVAVLFPQSVREVQACVRIANEFNVPLYPISKGKNWGYGSKVPPTSHCAIISLECMNRIISFDEELGYITVEPGVTFQQVYEFLTTQKSSLIAPSIGSIPDASLIGNAVERGIGKGVYGDRFQHACNMEVVLPTNEVVHTGFGNIDNAQTKDLYRWGVGPSLDGLFTQSNFGIVTKMTFWLQPKPAYFQTFFYTTSRSEQVPELVNALRKLRLEGTLNTTATLSNDYRILSMKQQFSSKMAGSGGTVSEEYIGQLRKNIGGAVWVGDDAILAPTKAQGKARAKRLKQVLGPIVDKLILIDDTKAKLYGWLYKPIKWLTRVDVRELLYFHFNSLYLGKPLKKQVAMCYFRKKETAPEDMDLDRDKCGVIWCSPSVPFEGRHVSKALDILYKCYKKHGFEPNIGLNFMSERSLAFTSAIIYDREAKGEDARAMACYNDIMQSLCNAGYVPYRLGTQSMEEGMMADSAAYQHMLAKIKHALDPNDIVSPMHYGISGQLMFDQEQGKVIQIDKARHTQRMRDHTTSSERHIKEAPFHVERRLRPR